MSPRQSQLWNDGEEDNEWVYSQRDYIVLSLQKLPYELILSGKKKYEYRRRFRTAPSVAFVYVSSPVKQISLSLQLGRAITGDAQHIADVAEAQCQGNWNSVFKYLEEGNRGYAIPILNYKTFAPVSLEYLREGFDFFPPQLYLSLQQKQSLFDFLFQRANLQDIGHPVF